MAELHGWQKDPYGVHERRYFSQGQPTKLVRDGNIEMYDPPPQEDRGLGAVVGGGGPPAPPARPAPVFDPTPPHPGWWLASDGNWYAPELAESPPTPPLVPGPAPPAPVFDPTPPHPGWWLASDGNWYAPELAESPPTPPLVPGPAPPAPPAPVFDPTPPHPGWWLASDGNWYAPELAESPFPADPAPWVAPTAAQAASPEAQWGEGAPVFDPTPPHPGWWLASDGNWYAPELAESPPPTPNVPDPAPPVAPAAAQAASPEAPWGEGEPVFDLTPPHPGWWLASDGNWYAPELGQPAPLPTLGVDGTSQTDLHVGSPTAGDPTPSVPSVPGPPRQVADTPAPDRPQTAPTPPPPHPGWWLASDGNLVSARHGPAARGRRPGRGGGAVARTSARPGSRPRCRARCRGHVGSAGDERQGREPRRRPRRSCHSASPRPDVTAPASGMVARLRRQLVPARDRSATAAAPARRMEVGLRRQLVSVVRYPSSTKSAERRSVGGAAHRPMRGLWRSRPVAPAFDRGRQSSRSRAWWDGQEPRAVDRPTLERAVRHRLVARCPGDPSGGR